MVSELVRMVRSNFFIATTAYKKISLLVCGCLILLMACLVSPPCFAEEAAETQGSIQEESYDIPGSTFYVPKSMFQTTEAYEDYCIHMYELGYMNGQFEWTDAAQAFIDDPQNLDVAEALEEDRQRILSERELESEEEYTSVQEPAAQQTEIVSENTDSMNSEVRMTEVSEMEEQRDVITEKKNPNISFGAILLVLFVIFLGGAFYSKNRKK